MAALAQSGLKLPSEGTDNGRAGLIKDAIFRMPGEFASIVRYPFDEPGEFAKYALGIGLLIALDKPLTRAYQDHIERAIGDFKLPDAPGPFKHVGTGGADGWLVLGIAGTYLGGLASDDVRAQKVGLAASKSVVYSLAVSQLLLKSIAGRKRPIPNLSSGAGPSGAFTDNPHDFGNKRNPTLRSDQYASAFPSFHFTAWFATAKVYQEAYDNYWLPYSALAVGLASNAKAHQHWVSDMAAGALIGTLIGSTVSKDYFGDTGRLKLQATVGGGGPRVQVSYAF